MAMVTQFTKWSVKKENTTKPFFLTVLLKQLPFKHTVVLYHILDNRLFPLHLRKIQVYRWSTVPIPSFLPIILVDG